MRNYAEWLETVPEAVTNDTLWRMKAYRLALFIGELAWHDATQLAKDRKAVGLADQLFRACGSIGANIAEGYSRRSGKDRAHFYEYALGSARESRHWYKLSTAILSERVVTHRINLLIEIIRILLSIIPTERTHNLAEAQAPYNTDLPQDLAQLPLPAITQPTPSDDPQYVVRNTQ